MCGIDDGFERYVEKSRQGEVLAQVLLGYVDQDGQRFGKNREGERKGQEMIFFFLFLTERKDDDIKKNRE